MLEELQRWFKELSTGGAKTDTDLRVIASRVVGSLRGQTLRAAAYALVFISLARLAGAEVDVGRARREEWARAGGEKLREHAQVFEALLTKLGAARADQAEQKPPDDDDDKKKDFGSN